MKAGIVLLLGFFSMVSALAQGTVNFANLPGTEMHTNSTPTPPPGQLPNQWGLTTGAGQYTVGLYIAPEGTLDYNAFTLLATTPSLSGPGGDGLYDGGIIAIPGNTGQPIAYQLRAWSTAFGTSRENVCCGGYQGLMNGGFGTVTPAMGGTPPRLLGTDFFLLPAVPEPSSTALVCLGVVGGIMVWAQRRKRKS